MTDIRIPASPRFVLGDPEDALAITRPLYGPDLGGGRRLIGQVLRDTPHLGELLGKLEGRMTAEDVARIAHEANRGYCSAIGDDTAEPWASTSPEQRTSILAGVDAIITDPTITPTQLHTRWVEHKRAAGWVYGRVKNAEAKTHPCLVDYAELSLAQRVKDHIFASTVRACLGYT